MNKKYRNELKRLKYINRLRYWASIWTLHITREGDTIVNPTVQDLVKDRAFLKLKTQAVLCSCSMCSKEYKYKRKDFKFETYKIIKEGLEDFYGE